MKLSADNLKYIGASLYWGEGTKARLLNTGTMYYSVEFTNNDPDMIKIFLKFLRNSIGAVEERIKIQLFIYTDQDAESIKIFWRHITNIPFDRFQQNIVLSQRSGRFHPSKYGTCKIRYPHKEHFLKIQGIIAQLKGGVA